MKTPILVVGDAGNVLGGLARIARDITALLHQDSEGLGVDVAHAGIRCDGQPWPWRTYPLFDEENWGRGDVDRVWKWHAQGRKGVVLTVWDPSRCWEITKALTREGHRNPPELWGYFAVDSETEKGGFGGPAAEAVRRYHRVLAYGSWGMKVLRKVVQKEKDVKWLPHGMELDKWENNGWAGRRKGVRLLGCVATNQPRKDWGLFFSAAEKLRSYTGWENLHLWVNVDYPVKSWSIPELAELYGWNSEKLIVTQELGQQELANMYGACDVTLGIGSGEGFGYPLVESLACGTPVVHGKFAGGQEWIPRADWLVEPIETRVEGLYGLLRPIYDPWEVAKTLAKAGDEKLKDFQVTSSYCKGAVSNLDWKVLWARYRSWVKAGLKGIER